MKFSIYLHLERTSNSKRYEELYNEFIELSILAEKVGFNTIWTGEHHGMDFSISSNPLLLLSNIAAHTTHIKLGTATIISPFWHPVKLAGEISLCNLITGNRLELGISKGAYKYEYDRIIPDSGKKIAGEMFRESLIAIKNLWKGNYTHNGKYWKFPSTTITPRQKTPIPLWVACEHPFTFNFAIDHNCNIQVAPLFEDDSKAKILMDRFTKSLERNKEIIKPKIMILRHTYVGQTEEELLIAARKFAIYYIEFNSWFENKNEVIDAKIKYTPSENEINVLTKKLLKNLMIEKPNQMIERLKEYEKLGYDEYVLCLSGEMNFSEKKKNIQLFSEKVMSAF